MKTLVGAWLGDDLEKNEEEIEALITLANEGCVDIAAVGNEVLYRNDLTLEQLLGYIKRVKEALPNIPVGYVDAYYEFSRHPELVEVSDVILANCYPYWEGCSIEHSLNHMQQMFGQATDAGQGKPVIITETGWPSQGEGYKGYREGQQPGGICPSYEEVKEDLSILSQNWKYLRLYDCDQHTDTILEVIKNEKLDFKVMLGAYIVAEMNNHGCPWGGTYSEEAAN
ncbi:unnamed protein product [Bathycoccus prasinos]